MAGQTYTLVWSYTGDVGRYVQIQLYKGGDFKSTISTYVSAGDGGRGTYNWKVPSSLPQGNDCQIKIFSRTTSTVFALSDMFSIGQPAQTGQPDISPLPPAPPSPSGLRPSDGQAPPPPPSTAQSGPDLTINQVNMQPDPANLGANVNFSITVNNERPAGAAACKRRTAKANSSSRYWKSLARRF